MPTLLDFLIYDEDEYNSQATLIIKETNSCVISDAGEKSSFGAVRRNFATKLAEPSRIFNRDSATSLGIAATLDILEDLSSDSSSSSSSSFGEFDFTFLNSNKKIKTNGDQR